MPTLTTRFRGEKIVIEQYRPIRLPNGRTFGDIPVYETVNSTSGIKLVHVILAEIVWEEMIDIAHKHGVAEPVVVRPAYLIDG